MRSGLSPSAPAQHGIDLHVRLGGRRNGLARQDRDIEEPHLAQAILGQHAAPVAVDRQLDVLGDSPAEIHRGIARVGRRARGPGKLEVAQLRPGGAIGRVLHRHALGPEAQHRFEHLVGVPDQQLVDLVDAVEFILNPRRLRPARGAEPHLGRLRPVLIAVVQARAVDALLRPHALAGARRGGGDLRNPVGHRLDGERPDTALEHRGIRSGVDFIDPPVVSPAEFQQTRRVEGSGGLVFAHQHVRRIGPVGVGDNVQGGPEVHITRGRRRSGRPAQDHVARHILPAVGGTGIGGFDRFRQALIAIPPDLIDVDAGGRPGAGGTQGTSEDHGGQRTGGGDREGNTALDEVLRPRQRGRSGRSRGGAEVQVEGVGGIVGHNPDVVPLAAGQTVLEHGGAVEGHEVESRAVLDQPEARRDRLGVRRPCGVDGIVPRIGNQTDVAADRCCRSAY